ncbi:MAG: protein kinase [Thermoanaerobaculaceae bacterium]|nr:protein kinase [Thermoanaerobaculaceae bacterium]
MVTPGTRLGPYEVVALIGAGGMGEVYKARDTRLGRDVAIKVLPAQVAADPDRLRRFEQEARAVAALDHPNILAIHDIGSHEGAPYIVTELLEGESLREKLTGSPLPPRKVLGVAIQVASGLAAAHEKGIVHRDLKPENIFVTRDGQAKILDFGVAKLVPKREQAERSVAPTVLERTDPGIVMGTAGYMSPEQVRGQSVDHRSDIFSFGCVLYEMVTGRRAFARATAADTMAAILTEEPPDPSGIHQAVLLPLSRVIAHCLEKQPEERFESARDLVFELRAILADTGPAKPATITTSTRRRRVVGLALAAVTVLVAAGVLVLRLKPAGQSARAAKPPKIVVLPFENLGAPEDAYFAAGMTEEITSRLANVQGLGVISRTSATEYTRRGKTVKEIGSELGVDYVLEGSVRWERGAGRESRVRITPQLIRVTDDTHVWADRYERVIADVFAIQSEVAENAVKAMGVALLPRERTALKEVSTNNLEAYDLYLRGRELASRSEKKAEYEGALQMYQAAVDRDPRFAQALAGLATSHLAMYWNYYDRSQERLVKAKEAADRAVELRPDLAETHTALGFYFYWGLLDYPRALSEFSAALKLQLNSSDALAAIGFVVRRQGRWAESADQLSKALELDPKNAVLLNEFGNGCIFARRYAEADRALRLAIAMSPHWEEPYVLEALLQIRWHGDVGKAQAVLDEAHRVAELRDERYLAGSALGLALLRRDYQTGLRQLEAETRHTFDNLNYHAPIPLVRGEWQMLAGQHDLARHSFEAARVELEQKVAQDPDDPRFHSSLGIAYAGLGRRLEAVREAKLGCDLMPASKDAWRALYRLEDLATVYTMVGQPGEAIAQLEDLLQRSGEFTPHVLRLDPRWDPLRSDPRFQALLTKYEFKP